MKKTLVFLLFGWQAHAEETVQTPSAPPGSEILLFDIHESDDGELSLGKAHNISNSKGYDSQPRFSKDGQFIYYTHFENGQMDIHQYNLTHNVSTPYMVTAESEYSPTPMPEKEGLSVVQVDVEGDQYLVLLNNQLVKEKQTGRYSDLKQVGYFNWTQDGYLWSFVLNDNNGGDLYVQNSDKKATKVTENIGRSFITDARSEQLYFVDKKTTPWRIQKINHKSLTPKPVMVLPMGVEDFTLDSKGRFWAGRDNTLFVSLGQQRWYIAHEFSDPHYHQITRVTTNPQANKIAIVFAEKDNSE
ncbi:MAG: PD40 domain-containing protein [Xanthomonadales bacterium]|nr:PD40 domain-containing protein [Xanthomonadales bacterium]